MKTFIRPKPDLKRGCRLSAIFLLITLFLVTACALPQIRQENAKAPPQWPPYPNPARIVWVKDIKDHKDFGISKSFWKRMLDMITGGKDSGIVRPYGIFVDNKKRLFVVDVGASVVHFMDLQENTYKAIGEEKDATFRTPIGVAGDENENIYITDSEAGVVFRYSISDNRLTPFIPALMRPTGIAFNKKNSLLYVTDTKANHVVVFDLNGMERFRIGHWGDGPGQFNHPTDIFTDPEGKVYVTDPLNARIEVFSAEGKFLREFGTPGNTVGTFAKPKGVALDSEGHIYINDALFDTIQIFDASGHILLNFGENGTDAGQFWMPSGIFIDENDFIYIADTYNRRVQVFRYVKANK